MGSATGVCANGDVGCCGKNHQMWEGGVIYCKPDQPCRKTCKSTRQANHHQPSSKNLGGGRGECVGTGRADKEVCGPVTRRLCRSGLREIAVTFVPNRLGNLGSRSLLTGQRWMAFQSAHCNRSIDLFRPPARARRRSVIYLTLI